MNEGNGSQLRKLRFRSLHNLTSNTLSQRDGIHGGYRLVSTYDLPDSGPMGGGGWGYSGVKSENTQSAKKLLNFNFRGEGYFGVNFGHLKSEVFHLGGGIFRSKL